MTDRTMNMIGIVTVNPWHTGGSYDDFMKKGMNILKDVLEFNHLIYIQKGSREINQSLKITMMNY